MQLSVSQRLEALLEKLRYRWRWLFCYTQCPFGPEYQEAWNHRYELFSRFDEGVKTDAVGLYSVTPEKVAQVIAGSVAGKTVVDAFCGVGGNAIAFGAVCLSVTTVDTDKVRLMMARHNAEVYRRDNIEFICGDFLSLAPSLNAEVVFLDPPWGGPDYDDKAVFRLADFSPHGKELLEISFAHFKLVILRVPYNFDLAELAQFNRVFEIQPNLLHGRLISQTIYFR